MKSVLVAIVVVVLVAAAGVGGYLYGQSQCGSDAGVAEFDPTQMQPGQFPRGQIDPSQLTEEQRAAMQQRFAQGGRTGQGGGGLMAGDVFEGGAMGEITAIEGDVVTVRTEDAAIEVKTTNTTLIEKLMSVTVEDLEVGERVAVSGSEGDDGTTTARSIRVMTTPGR